MSRLQVTKVKVRNMLKKALPADVQYEIRGAGDNWKIECMDRRANVLVLRALRKAKMYNGGFLTGHGGWIYDNVDRSGYQYTCDFCDKASIHHY